MLQFNNKLSKYTATRFYHQISHAYTQSKTCANIRDLLSRIQFTFENMQSIGVTRMLVLIESKHRSGISLTL